MDHYYLDRIKKFSYNPQEMSSSADKPTRPEVSSEQPIQVDLQIPIDRLFPTLSSTIQKPVEELQQVLTTQFREVVALPNIINNKWRIEFRSNDRQNRLVAELPDGPYSYVVDMSLDEAHKNLYDQRRDRGVASQALIYDTLLDKPQEFAIQEDALVHYVSHLEEMIADDGYLIVQLTDKSTPTHTGKVLEALKMRFGKPAITKSFEVVGDHPTKGVLLAYRKGADIFPKPRFDTDVAAQVPVDQGLFADIDAFLRTRRLAGTGSN